MLLAHERPLFIWRKEIQEIVDLSKSPSPSDRHKLRRKINPTSDHYVPVTALGSGQVRYQAGREHPMRMVIASKENQRELPRGIHEVLDRKFKIPAFLAPFPPGVAVTDTNVQLFHLLQGDPRYLFDLKYCYVPLPPQRRLQKLHTDRLEKLAENYQRDASLVTSDNLIKTARQITWSENGLPSPGEDDWEVAELLAQIQAERYHESVDVAGEFQKALQERSPQFFTIKPKRLWWQCVKAHWRRVKRKQRRDAEITRRHELKKTAEDIMRTKSKQNELFQGFLDLQTLVAHIRAQQSSLVSIAQYN